MFAKRLAAERSESPETSVHPESRRGSTVADTDGEIYGNPGFSELELTRFNRTALVSGTIPWPSRQTYQSIHTGYTQYKVASRNRKTIFSKRRD